MIPLNNKNAKDVINNLIYFVKCNLRKESYSSLLEFKSQFIPEYHINSEEDFIKSLEYIQKYVDGFMIKFSLTLRHKDIVKVELIDFKGSWKLVFDKDNPHHLKFVDQVRFDNSFGEIEIACKSIEIQYFNHRSNISDI